MRYTGIIGIKDSDRERLGAFSHLTERGLLMNNNKIKIAQAMLDVVLEYVEAYKNDVIFDYSAIFEDVDYNGAYMWAIRPTGTYLSPLNDTYHNTMCYASIEGGYSQRFFVIDISAGTLSEVTREEALSY